MGAFHLLVLIDVFRDESITESIALVANWRGQAGGAGGDKRNDIGNFRLFEAKLAGDSGIVNVTSELAADSRQTAVQLFGAASANAESADICLNEFLALCAHPLCGVSRETCTLFWVERIDRADDAGNCLGRQVLDINAVSAMLSRNLDCHGEIRLDERVQGAVIVGLLGLPHKVNLCGAAEDLGGGEKGDK